MGDQAARDHRREGDAGDRGRLTLRVPRSALVVLVGPAGSGKTTFARAHFAEHEVLSTDWFRKVVSNDENDQSATPQAFAILRFIAARRIRRGGLTVVDATSLTPWERAPLLHIAERYGRRAVAVVFELPLETCLLQNRARATRSVSDEVVRWQWDEMHRIPHDLVAEGFKDVLTFWTAAEVARASVTRE